MGCLAAGVRALVLFDDPFAHGYDGYYYALQVRSLLSGAPLFDDTSAVFWLLAAVGWVLGDVVVGNKLVVCVLGALASIGGSVAAWRWWGHRGAAAVTGMLFALSPLHLSVSSEFVKNAAGTAVLAWLLAALAGSERSVRRMGVCIALAGLGLAVHKLTGVFGLVMTASVAITWLPTVRRRQVPAWVWGAVAVTLAVVASVGVLRVVDLARFVEGLGRFGRRMSLLDDGRLGWGEKLAVFGVHAAPLAIGVLAWRRRREADRGLWWGLFVLSVAATAPGLPMAYDLTAWRLVLMGFVPVGLVFGWAASQRAWLGVVAVAVALAQLPNSVSGRQQREPDYPAWSDWVDTIAHRVGDDEAVVAHRGLCGFLWAETGRRCENFRPTGDVSSWWRVTYGFGSAQLQPYGPVVRLAPGYLLVREEAYRRFADEHDYILLEHALNPYRERPGFVYGPRAGGSP